MHRVLLFNIFLASLSLIGSRSYAQVGCLAAGFDTDANCVTGFDPTGNGGEGVGTDDWFFSVLPPGGNGKGVLDTTQSAYLKALIQTGAVNHSFTKGMSYSPLDIVDGRMLMDALYIRDYQSGLGDSTSFSGTARNAGNPQSDWTGGTNSIPAKNDILDAYMHSRREGSNSTDPLWLFGGIVLDGTSGSRYADFELYQKDMTFNRATGRFIHSGSEEGHTAWTFDGLGNVDTPGDVNISATIAGSGIASYEVRIWVSRNDYNTLTPASFYFGGSFEGSSNKSDYGYASISPLISASFCAISNTLVTPAPPWGSVDGSGAYQATYDANQFVEFGLRISDLGLDWEVRLTNTPCEKPFKRMMVKTRTSQSFSSQLKDFTGPQDFLQLVPELEADPDNSLTCAITKKQIGLEVYNPNIYYTWSTPDGNILSSPIDTTILIDQPGTYIVEAKMDPTCPVINTDTVVVSPDTVAPNATAAGGTLSLGVPTINLTGASGIPTPAHYYWTHNNGFNSTLQNPAVSDTGTYQLVVTDLENGCKDTAVTQVFYDAILGVEFVIFEAKPISEVVELFWSISGEGNGGYFVVERAVDGNPFELLDQIPEKKDSPDGSGYFFRDPYSGLQNITRIQYRIRHIDPNGNVTVSSIIELSSEEVPFMHVYVDPFRENTNLIISHSSINSFKVFNSTGQIMVVNRFPDAQSGSFQVSTEGWTRGIYYCVSYMKNGAKFTRKILI